MVQNGFSPFLSAELLAFHPLLLIPVLVDPFNTSMFSPPPPALEQLYAQFHNRFSVPCPHSGSGSVARQRHIATFFPHPGSFFISSNSLSPTPFIEEITRLSPSSLDKWRDRSSFENVVQVDRIRRSSEVSIRSPLENFPLHFSASSKSSSFQSARLLIFFPWLPEPFPIQLPFPSSFFSFPGRFTAVPFSNPFPLRTRQVRSLVFSDSQMRAFLGFEIAAWHRYDTE